MYESCTLLLPVVTALFVEDGRERSLGIRWSAWRTDIVPCRLATQRRDVCCYTDKVQQSSLSRCRIFPTSGENDKKGSLHSPNRHKHTYYIVFRLPPPCSLFFWAPPGHHIPSSTRPHRTSPIGTLLCSVWIRALFFEKSESLSGDGSNDPTRCETCKPRLDYVKLLRTPDTPGAIARPVASGIAVSLSRAVEQAKSPLPIRRFCLPVRVWFTSLVSWYALSSILPPPRALFFGVPSQFPLLFLSEG